MQLHEYHLTNFSTNEHNLHIPSNLFAWKCIYSFFILIERTEMLFVSIYVRLNK